MTLDQNSGSLNFVFLLGSLNLFTMFMMGIFFIGVILFALRCQINSLFDSVSLSEITMTMTSRIFDMHLILDNFSVFSTLSHSFLYSHFFLFFEGSLFSPFVDTATFSIFFIDSYKILSSIEVRVKVDAAQSFAGCVWINGVRTGTETVRTHFTLTPL